MFRIELKHYNFCITYFKFKSIRFTRILLFGWILCVYIGSVQSQNQNNKWFFGAMAGLDFNSVNPTPLLNSVMGAPLACSNICDQNGNLLFYTHAATIWNQNHIVMANGNMSGNPGGAQSVLILKKPGATSIYYAFVLNFASANSGLISYSIDMSLAGGTGSVVSFSFVSVPHHVYSSEKITGTSHCNGIDYWLVVHPKDKPEFYSILISNAGIANNPVISQVGIDTIKGQGYMKISPTGKKIALVGKRGDIILHDFDNLTGAVSTNSILLFGTSNAFGIEFSPDGSKLYMSSGRSGNSVLWQWDLCAGNSAAINNSKQIIYSDNSTQNGALHLGPNGKIYKARNGVDTLGVIRNPNAAGAICNYVNSGQTLAGNACGWGLPNQIPKIFIPQITIQTTVSCQNVTLSPVNTIQCSAISNNSNSNIWNFGDPLSGSANTSTLMNSVHRYSNIGTYTAMLIQYYNCRVDTIYKTIQISSINPTINISGKDSICAGEKLTLNALGSGILSYQWNSGSTSNSLATNPSTTTTYSVIGSNSIGCVGSSSINVQVFKCLSLKSNTNDLEFKIFPNPNSGEFLLDTESIKVIRINVISLLGEEINISINQSSESLIKLDLQNAQSGIYVLKITTENSVYYKQIIKVD